MGSALVLVPLLAGVDERAFVEKEEPSIDER